MQSRAKMGVVFDLTLMPAMEELAVAIWICGTEPRLKVEVRARCGLLCMLSSRLNLWKVWAHLQSSI